MKKSLLSLALALLILSGCGPKLDVLSTARFAESMSIVTYALPPEKQKEFAESLFIVTNALLTEAYHSQANALLNKEFAKELGGSYGQTKSIVLGKLVSSNYESWKELLEKSDTEEILNMTQNRVKNIILFPSVNSPLPLRSARHDEDQEKEKVRILSSLQNKTAGQIIALAKSLKEAP